MLGEVPFQRSFCSQLKAWHKRGTFSNYTPIYTDLSGYRPAINCVSFGHIVLSLPTPQDQQAPGSLCANGFFYLDFIWVVSCVMSRQNQIPSSNGRAAALALIPLWDMCNHTNGQITTDFDLENHGCICYAGSKMEAGGQFTIFYGARPNADLLLHQGFVYPENSHDSLKIKLGTYAVAFDSLIIKLGMYI